MDLSLRMKVLLGKDINVLQMEHNELFLKAYILVNRMFYNDVDKSGVPYVNHLYSVSMQMDSEEEKVVGLMHDIIEDTIVTKEDLLALGFPSNIVQTIDILTKKENQEYSEYIDSIISSKNITALKVKKADMENNMDEDRLKLLSAEERIKLRNKYKKFYPKICTALTTAEILKDPIVLVKKGYKK